MNGVDSLGSNQECRIGYRHSHSRVSQCLASIRKPGNRRSSAGLRSFKPSKGTNLFILDYIKTHHKGKKLPSSHVLGDFNFKDIDWPDRLSKSGSTLSQSEGQILIDIMNDHGLEQMVHFPPYLVSFKMSTPLTNLVIMTSSQEP